MKKRMLILFTLIISAVAHMGYAQEKYISIYVTPFYSAYNGKVEYVNTYTKTDQLLQNNNIADFKKAVKIIEDKPEYVSPITLFVLSARAYDLGLRDEAVFWFYNGKNRFITLMETINVEDPMFFESRSAIGAFLELAGNPINSYAFCDMQKQKQMAQKSIDWVKAHPYLVIFSQNFPSNHQDRKQALIAAEKVLDDNLAKQQQYFADPKNMKKFLQARKDNNADKDFCWK